MSDRRERNRTKNRTVAYIAAGIVHAGIIAALLINFTSEPDTINAEYAEKVDVIAATTIDESQIKKEQDRIKKLDRDKKKKSEKEIRDLKKQADREKQRLVDLQAQRKIIALQKQRDKEKYEKELRERKRKEELAKKRKKELEELERIKREEQEYAAQQQMNQMLAVEEAKVRAATLQGKYTGLIKEKVNRERNVAPDTERWRVTTVNVRLSASGDVLSVRTVNSSGDARYDRSVETAIFQASPLPIPSVSEDPGVNSIFQNLNLTFDMSDV